MNTLKHFVKRSMQKLEDNPKESCKADKMLFTAPPFCLKLWFREVSDATFETTVLIDWTQVIYFWQIGHSHSFYTRYVGV